MPEARQSRFGTTADGIISRRGRVADRELLTRLPVLTKSSALHRKLHEIELEAEAVRNDPNLSDEQRASALSKIEAKAKRQTISSANAAQKERIEAVEKFQSNEISEEELRSEMENVRMSDQIETPKPDRGYEHIKFKEGVALDLSDPAPESTPATSSLMDSICDASDILIKELLVEHKNDMTAVLRTLRKQAGVAMYDASKTNNSKEVEGHLVAVAINSMAYACLHEQLK
jgi:hypothetical protein